MTMTQATDSKPAAHTPGAMRAAQEINRQWRQFVAEKYGEEPARGPENTDSLTAEIIERETRAPELLAENERLKAQVAELVVALRGLTHYADAVRYQAGMGPHQLKRLEAAKAAIAKATQP